MSARKILVTSALPYANGHIHIGHLVEYIQTDIWVRFQKLQGHRCLYLCADDTHGTAIMIRARQEGRSEEALIADMREAHLQDFAGFDIEFDNFGSTNSEANRELCHKVWAALRAAGLIVERDVSQLYDTTAGTFLADRFVRGTCPHCQSPNQYGDSCDKCGQTYSPSDLIDPVSTLSGTTPEVRTARHLFVQIESLHEFLEQWTQNGDSLQPEVANYLKGHFLSEPLRDWDVSRPAPYFGFEIPDSPGNYWYVWFDAPVGYMASLQEWCTREGAEFDDWWPRGEDAEQRGAEIHHFIGKDITYFHTLFWPAMLKSAGFKLPTKVHIHGFLTVAGDKMSKTRGTFVRAATYLQHLNPAYLRYYYATKLTPKVDDIDLNLEEFVNRVNADLVGKVVNIASRTASFVGELGLADQLPEEGQKLFEAASSLYGENGPNAGVLIQGAYERGGYLVAMTLIMELAEKANKYLEIHAPWNLKKEGKTQELQEVCTTALNLFRQIVVYLSPVLPSLQQQADELFGVPIQSWTDANTPLLGSPLRKFRHMLKRLELPQVQAMIAASIEAAPATETPASPDASQQDGPEALAAEPLEATCTIDDFVKVDMRVARVVAAEDVPQASKLLKLTLSLGGDSQRTVFAGIKGVYEPAALVGRLVICCANLAPRKMKFGMSEGMVLAAGPGGKDIFLLSPDSGAVPGQRVH